ncbi:MAG: thioredoxin family protein [Gemmatimonadota bacterium]
MPDASVVLAWSPTCPHCKAMMPLVEGVARDFEGRVRYQSLNVAENPDAARALAVRAVPTLVALSGSTVLGRHLGAGGEGVVRGLFQSALDGTRPVSRPAAGRGLPVFAAVALGALAWWTGEVAVLGTAAVGVLAWGIWPRGGAAR